MSNSSIWPLDRTLSGTTTLGQSGPGSDDNKKGVSSYSDKIFKVFDQLVMY